MESFHRGLGEVVYYSVLPSWFQTSNLELSYDLVENLL